MVRIYLRQAIRNFGRNKFYSFINTLGLTISVATFLLIGTYTRYEFSFDQFHEDAGRIYRVDYVDSTTKALHTPKGFLNSIGVNKDVTTTWIFHQLGASLVDELPSVDQSFRFSEGYNGKFKIGSHQFADNFYFVDRNFFSFLSFKLAAGDPSSALAKENNLVLSKTIAKKFFGNEDPIGMTVSVSLNGDSTKEFLVTGVLADYPETSSLQPNILIRLEHNPSYNQSWGAAFTLIKTGKGVTESKLNSDIKRFTQTHMKFGRGGVSLVSKKLTDLHFDQNIIFFPNVTNPFFAYILLSLGILVLIVTFSNYFLLTLTNISSRMKEVNIRKVIGARRSQLFMQLWIESMLTLFISTMCGIILAQVFLPVFNDFINLQLHIPFENPRLLLGVLIFFVSLNTIISLLATSSFLKRHRSPVIQMSTTYRFNPFTSRFLIAIQYGLCIFLITMAIIMNRQMSFLSRSELGYTKDGIIVVRNPEESRQKTMSLLTGLRQFIVTHHEFRDITVTSNELGKDADGQYDVYREGDHDERVFIRSYDVDANFIPMMNINLIEGRNFSENTAADLTTYIVNKTLADMLGPDRLRVGEYCEILEGVVIGITDDFKFRSLENKIEPLMMRYRPERAQQFLIKLGEGNPIHAIGKLQKEWAKATGGKPFQHTFLDDDIAKQYENQKRWITIIETVALIAILISCLGLFSLSGIYALNRKKEVSIRKVMGASLTNIVLLLNRNILLIAIIAFVTATPLAYAMAQRWLEDFAYKTSMGWEIFAMAALASLFTGGIAVGYHSVKSALINPADSLRNE